MEFTSEQKAYAQIVQKAWDDADFKKALIANPLAAIENVGYHVEIPKGQKFVVIDQTDESTIYLNIPRQVSLDGLELSEEQLEMVAGGISPTLVALGYGFMAGCAFIAAAAGVKAAQ